MPTGPTVTPTGALSSLLATATTSVSPDAAAGATDRRPKFPRDEVGFHTELQRRVAAYFTRTGRPARDCWQMYLKTAILLGWFAASYVLLVFFTSSLWLAVPLTVSMAAALTAIAFNVQHDGGHHAYSRFEWVNRLAAYTLDLVGASSYLWKWKHGVFHHTYTNIAGHDTDSDAGVFARLAPHQRRRWFHRWQHLYLWLLYGLTASNWHLYADFKDVVKGTIGPHKIPRPRGWDLVGFLGGKAISVGFWLVLPMFFHPWWLVLSFYLLATCVIGVGMTIVFQLAHCVGEADFPVPEGDSNRMAAAWAVLQIETTVDFARDSRVLTFLLGGLNFQIEHHLFPRVSHVHYPALSRIVEETCREYGVRYGVHPSFVGGIVSHYRWLKRMGRPDPKPAAA
jgi:linoleoyl-CoA desaturase